MSSHTAVFYFLLYFGFKYSYAFQVTFNGSFLICGQESSKMSSKRPYHTIEECHRKIRLNINLYNKEKTPEGLEYIYIKEVADPSGIKMKLLNPIVLRMRQTQVVLAYPFKYLSAVNGKASEVVVNNKNRKNYTGCDDTSFIQPTCGLKHYKGVAIPFSEGFCCFCPESSKTPQLRGGQDCSNFVDPTNLEEQKMKASAHCLRFDEIWYSVNALNDPIIIHDVSLQVFNERYLTNGSVLWVSLTHNQEFELGIKNPSQFDLNKTIVVTYFTANPKNDSLLISAEDNRLLIPQPMPNLDTDKLPTAVKNGATDYLLVSKAVISPRGRECDTAGVSYEGFSKQPNRCDVRKDTCLKNQPLDFWENDDKERKAGNKGKYLLENYGTPYKDPIRIDKETKKHWLAMEYYKIQHTELTIEFNADKIVALMPGKQAQVSQVITVTYKEKIFLYVKILNQGLSPALFAVQVTKCEYGVPDSQNVSMVVPPQRMEELVVTAQPGDEQLSEKFTCSVEVRSQHYGTVATRKVLIKPTGRCICNMHCKCVCFGDSLKCEPLLIEDFHAAGFQGSLPVMVARQKRKVWASKHPFLAILGVILFLLLLGLAKAIIGMLYEFNEIGDWGYEDRIYAPKKINAYIERDALGFKPYYDNEGYPVNPETNKHARVITHSQLFAMNFFFFFLWPCLKLFDTISDSIYDPASTSVGGETTELDSETPGTTTESSGSQASSPIISGRQGPVPHRSGPQGPVPHRSGPQGAVPRRSGPQDAVPRRSGPQGPVARRSDPQDLASLRGSLSQGSMPRTIVPITRGSGAVVKERSYEDDEGENVSLDFSFSDSEPKVDLSIAARQNADSRRSSVAHSRASLKSTLPSKSTTFEKVPNPSEKNVERLRWQKGTDKITAVI